jgi:ribonuclease HI
MLECYADGSSNGKRGEGGWGFVVLQNNLVIEKQFGGEDDTTNNRMELLGAINCLKYIYNNHSTEVRIVLKSDSQYVIKGITEWFPGWEIKMAKGKEIINQDLWIEFKRLKDLFSDLHFEWVRGHIGIQYNEICDILAKQGKAQVVSNRR